MPAESRPPTYVARIFIGVISIYRYTLAYLIGGRCRFYPSCSIYGQQAIHRFGAARGGWLTLKRIGRCHPWHEGGVDPIPEALADYQQRNTL